MSMSEEDSEMISKAMSVSLKKKKKKREKI